MIKKIINFGLVGVFATAIEYILLIVLKEFFNVDVIIAILNMYLRGVNIENTKTKIMEIIKA